MWTTLFKNELFLIFVVFALFHVIRFVFFSQTADIEVRDDLEDDEFSNNGSGIGISIPRRD